MNLPAIKEIIAQIKKDTGLQIVKANMTAPQPLLPYGVYNITSPFVKDRGKGSIMQSPNGTEKRTEQYKFTISFNIFAVDNETTIDLAHKVHQWFLFLGQEFIQDRNMAVVSVGNIENRTTFLIDNYEYKHGFDVIFRATDEQVRQITETIETINIGGM
ncbi:phage neck terminator protein [Fictibacillus gelatini]|uniref:phage neck terminator protein n=1 Tax=Fictibacillus gelatini TaxID=225985 RepID=UPI000404798A|nr:hypothetical protein [Fictibacillus gelatini]